MFREGTGGIASVSQIFAEGSKVMDAGFTKVVDLAQNYTGITTEHCQSFFQWYSGGDSARLTTRFDPDHNKRFVEVINSNSACNNLALVNKYKTQLKILSNLVLGTLCNHIIKASFKLFCPYKNDFAFISRATGKIKYDGLVLLRIAIAILKPDTTIDVRDLKENLELITLHRG